MTLAQRVEALEQAAALADGRLASDRVATVTDLVRKIGGRLRHGTDHTVVALVGPTGAGKSALFNALCGADLSLTGVRRPTTGEAHACVWGAGGGDLVDWLGIGRRHHLPEARPLDGLVLIDLPDFDSTAVEHRLEVDRLVQLVDLMVWVTDPQKYADESLHTGYLVPLARHGEVMRFVLNKIDTVPEQQRAAVVEDFEFRIGQDGIARPVVLATSVTDGVGLDDVHGLLATEVAAKTAAVARVDADLRQGAALLSVGAAGSGLSKAGRRDLIAGLGRAAGVESAVAIVAAQHRRDAREATTWPPLRWLRRRRRQPVADLPRAGASAVATAEVSAALRDAGEDAGDGFDPPWDRAIRDTALARQLEVARELGAVTTSTARAHRTAPKWWSLVRWVQGVLGLVALAGLLWLVAVALLGGFLQLATDPLLVDTPGMKWIPVPSLLLLGGTGLALLLALAAKLPAALGARRRARRARADLLDHVKVVADDQVVAHLEAIEAVHRQMENLLATAAG